MSAQAITIKMSVLLSLPLKTTSEARFHLPGLPGFTTAVAWACHPRPKAGSLTLLQKSKLLTWLGMVMPGSPGALSVTVCHPAHPPREPLAVNTTFRKLQVFAPPKFPWNQPSRLHGSVAVRKTAKSQEAPIIR